MLISLPDDAHAVTVITVDDEDSCLALPITGGNIGWNAQFESCVIGDGATLQIDSEEVLDLQVSFTVAYTGDDDRVTKLIVLHGGTVNVAAGTTFSPDGENFGTINIRAGGQYVAGLGVFYNAPSGIVNNYGELTASSDNPDLVNEGTINNYESGIFLAHSEWKVHNQPQGVINNYGFFHITYGLKNAGTVNNYGSAIFSVEMGAGGPPSPGGIVNNFGTIEVVTADDYQNAGSITNYGKIAIKGMNQFGEPLEGFVNDGTLINKASGVIENFGTFSNPGAIDNQGVISNYCGSTFTNSGSVTGKAVRNACEHVPPTITAPADVTLGTTGNRINLCQNLPVTGMPAIGDDGAGNVAAKTLDNNLSTRWSNGGWGSWIQPDLGTTKVICSVDIAWYKGDQRYYFFDISISKDRINFKKVFTGFSSGTTLSSERYEFEDSVGRYVKITVNANNVNTFASITEIDVNGYSSLGLPAFSDNLDPFPLVKNNVPTNGLAAGTNTVTWTAIDLNGNTNSDTQLVRVIAGDTVLPTISITSPATGSTITGPSTGVKVSLKGTASDSGSGVLKVELKSLKSGVVVHGYQQATPSTGGNWGTWTHTLTFTQTGTYTITARATDKAGNQNWYGITVKIAFQSDTTNPTVSITSPQNGASFSGPSSVPKKISLGGIAAESGSGVQKVELKSLKGGVGVHAYQQASTSNNWANWTHTLSFSASGTYTITARVTDVAGNQNWHSITVNITLR